MRHVREVIALLQGDCLARVKVEALMALRRPPNEIEVKTVVHPRGLTEPEVRRILELQDTALRRGPARLQMVPTLFQLAHLVEPAKVGSDGGWFYPFKGHPIGDAFEVCQQFDPEMVVEEDTWGPRVRACSAVTLPVLFEMARDGAWQSPDRIRNLERVLEKHRSSSIYLQIQRFLVRIKDCLNPESPIQLAMLHAAESNEWELIRYVTHAFFGAIGNETLLFWQVMECAIWLCARGVASRICARQCGVFEDPSCGGVCG
jgi:hypothetical protein